MPPPCPARHPRTRAQSSDPGENVLIVALDCRFITDMKSGFPEAVIGTLEEAPADRARLFQRITLMGKDKHMMALPYKCVNISVQ